MARRCQITGKGPKAGNNRSFSKRATRRRFNVNIISKKIDGKKMKIATSTLRTMLKQDREAEKMAEEILRG